MNGFEFQGYSLEVTLLGASLLLTLSVFASRISSKFGVPSLLLFLAIGMLAGSEGPGGIEFENYKLAFAIGSVCLALIIFDGGMRTSWKNVKPVFGVGVSLSLLGTLGTGVFTGVFAHFALDLGWIESMLLGSIVSSTDAAAVFSLLRAKALALKGRLKQTLEFEAGSNDPMAIFMTVGVLAFATSQATDALSLGKLFVLQWGLGLAMGWAGAKAARWLINHAGIEFEGLYGVLLLSLILVIFSATSSLGGSGFLAVYVAGLMLGNSDMLHKGSIIRFLDGIAWIAQILVFLTLGLLSFPSHLLPVWKEGIILSAFMMIVARPLSVMIAAPGSSLGKVERIFVSWVGLRGAAPIILATLPWGAGLPNGEHYFNLVFFVVLISVMIQGATVPWVAKRLGITVPLREKPGSELSAGMLPAGFVTVEIEVKSGAPAENKKVVDVGLPPGVLLTSLERAERYLIPRGDTTLMAGDRIWGLARPSNLDTLRKTFGTASAVT